jgi:hypothetical protein
MKRLKNPLATLFLIIILITMAEIFLLHQFYLGNISFNILLVLHVFLLIALSIILLLFSLFELDLKLIVSTFVLVAFMSAVGALCACIMILAYLFFSRHYVDVNELIADLLAVRKRDQAENLYENLLASYEDYSGKSHSVPYQDVLAVGTEDQKLIVLGKIDHFYNRSFAPLLFSAIQDKSNLIRVCAATVITKLHAKLLSKLHMLEEIYYSHQTSLKNLYKLAEYYDVCAASQLFDATLEGMFRYKAVALYERYLKTEKNDIAVKFSLGRLYLHINLPRKAYHLLKPRAMQLNAPMNTRLWFMECMFILHKYDELREYAKMCQAMQSSKLYASIDHSEVISAWALG